MQRYSCAVYRAVKRLDRLGLVQRGRVPRRGRETNANATWCPVRLTEHGRDVVTRKHNELAAVALSDTVGTVVSLPRGAEIAWPEQRASFTFYSVEGDVDTVVWISCHVRAWPPEKQWQWLAADEADPAERIAAHGYPKLRPWDRTKRAGRNELVWTTPERWAADVERVQQALDGEGGPALRANFGIA